MYGVRELTEEDIAHCLFLAQIDVGIYVADGPACRQLTHEYFVMRPSLYFIKDHPESDLYRHVAARQGEWAVKYVLSPEFKNQPNYEPTKLLILDEEGC